ncbi:hypothetical protein [Chitinasiproducens palmae]|uniref:Uncharacterized protein n=1 Tax=Chitinasiproducens palmae TaxID=1770053 RepID=A0A1H2PSG0_9BURK|nr:hypothetical protein [Chitinasiproducens palmae]SDV49916.1 hypothetical protein SAMN05216551_109237 [Chitinasiproducens palmae]
MSGRDEPDDSACPPAATAASSVSASPCGAAPLAAAPQFVPRPLSARVQQHHRTPEPGDLHLWRFQSHWVPASVGESQLWLGANERQSIRRLASPAARRRAALGWITLRWVAAGLAGCAPRDVELRRGSADGLKIVGTPLQTELLFTGFWVLLAVHREHEGAYGRTALAVSSASPISARTSGARGRLAIAGTADATGLEPLAREQGHGMADGATLGQASPATADARERLQRYALPMPPGAGVTLHVGPRVRRVRGFGWRTGDQLRDLVDAAGLSDIADSVVPR